MEAKETKMASYSFGKPAALLKATEEVGLLEAMNKYVEMKTMKGLTPAEYLLLTHIEHGEGLPSFEEEWENGKKNIVKAHRIKGAWYEKEFTGIIKHSETTNENKFMSGKQKKLVSWRR